VLLDSITLPSLKRSAVWQRYGRFGILPGLIAPHCHKKIAYRQLKVVLQDHVNARADHQLGNAECLQDLYTVQITFISYPGHGTSSTINYGRIVPYAHAGCSETPHKDAVQKVAASFDGCRSASLSWHCPEGQDYFTWEMVPKDWAPKAAAR
jgi:hypothetical protein